MSPNEIVQQIVKHLDAKEPAKARELFVGLRVHLDRGGSPPDKAHISIVLDALLRDEWDK